MKPRPAVLNPEGHPQALMTECGHVGPWGWINNLGRIVPMACNRPKAHTGLHGHAPKGGPLQQRWASSDHQVYTTSLKGPWQVIKRMV